MTASQEKWEKATGTIRFYVCFFAFILFVWYCALFCDEIETSV